MQLLGSGPLFNEMLKRIDKGEADGIICWKMDRLARNMVDGGLLVDMLQRGVIKEIITPSQVYRSADNVLTQIVDICQANQFVRDLSTNVKRGLRTKAEMGWPSGVAPIGFMNNKNQDKGRKEWVMDDNAFAVVRIFFQRALSGRYSAAQLARIASIELGMKSPLRRKEGGKPLKVSYVYELLKNPIYAGFFYCQNKRYELNKKLPRAMTEEQFWKLQDILGKRGIPRTCKRDGLFNHFSHCEECGGGLTPDFKFQLICSQCKNKFAYMNKEACPRCGIKISDMVDPKYLSYVYYACTSSKKHRTSCSKVYPEEQYLSDFVVDYIGNNLAISEALSKWCIDNVGEIKDPMLEEALAIARAEQQKEATTKHKLDKLMGLRLSRDNLEGDELKWFDDEEKKLRDEIRAINKKHAENKANDEDWLNKAEKSFSLMSEILDVFKGDNKAKKIDVMHEIGSNLTVKGKTINVINAKEVQLFVDCLKEARVKNDSFEPRNVVDTSERNEVFTSVVPTLLQGLKAVRTYLILGNLGDCDTIRGKTSL